jgi:uncharacterized protein YndB with AHSA1/START domain
MTELSTGTATVVIGCAPDVVWSAITDVTRMGEWSPECTSGRWVGNAGGPAVGSKFEGDNAAKVAGRTVKRWTTTSEVTACEPQKVFEFVAEGYTTWRYEFTVEGTGTRVTESFSYEAKGFQGFVYDTLMRRPSAMTKGMQATLERVKAALENA